jgi:hypothetical protein
MSVMEQSLQRAGGPGKRLPPADTGIALLISRARTAVAALEGRRLR